MDEKERREIAERFATARKLRKLTQQEIADKAGVSLGMINNLENGRTIPQRGNRARIAKALGEDVFQDGLSESARQGWTDDVNTVTLLLGQHLMALSPDERAAQITQWIQDVMVRRD